jgi:hypothetical protein
LIVPDIDRQRAYGRVDDRVRVAIAAGTVDAKNLGSEIGEEHRGVWSRTDAGELEHPDSRQRSLAR